jgi:hypothetical protein
MNNQIVRGLTVWTTALTLCVALPAGIKLLAPLTQSAATAAPATTTKASLRSAQSLQPSTKQDIVRCISEGTQAVMAHVRSRHALALNGLDSNASYGLRQAIQQEFEYEAQQDLLSIRVNCERDPTKRYFYDYD